VSDGFARLQREEDVGGAGQMNDALLGGRLDQIAELERGADAVEIVVDLALRDVGPRHVVHVDKVGGDAQHGRGEPLPLVDARIHRRHVAGVHQLRHVHHLAAVGQRRRKVARARQVPRLQRSHSLVFTTHIIGHWHTHARARVNRRPPLAHLSVLNQ
jgi:hypothetical protein